MKAEEYDEPEDLEPHESLETPEEEAEEEMAERLQMFGYGLQRLAQEQIGIRQQIEDRWLSDLEQYMGKYDAETSSRLSKGNGSQAFVNITRSKTTAAEARLSDMLFPSDDKNWGIQPTPVPEIAKMSNDFSVAGTDESGNTVTKSDIAAQVLKLARQRAQSMASEIDDQLTEARYHVVARDVIHDACLFGTGVIKGPIVINRTRKQWQQLDGAVHELQIVEELRPGVEHVKIWDFFPEMSATRIDDAEYVLERRYVTRKQLIELAKRPGYLKDQIRKVIAEAPRQLQGNGGTYVAKLRELSGLNASLDDNRYEVWEYHGPTDKENLRACGIELEDDELQELEVIVIFVNGRVIKADLNPLETNERPYSVFCFEEDDTSIFGFGVPYLLRNEQKIINAAWRMILDNAALSTGPQIVVNRDIVEPSDGAWDLKAKKIWWMNSDDPAHDVRDVFATYEISSHQPELTQIFEISRNMADDVTNLPMLAQGEKGDAPDTATGMSMLMNSANVVLRRIVKQFDDNVTKPFITRMYDWNMQNSDKEDIKGDFEVDARGSSALLVKETQNQALKELMLIAQQPPYSELTKIPDLYRKTVESHHISPDDIVKTNEEIEAEAQKPDPMRDHEMRMMQLMEEEQQAKIDKLKAEKTVKNIEGQYSAVQAGQTIATVPGVVPIADELLASAGYQDANGAPLAAQPTNAMPAMPMPPQNTDPRFPANPADPSVGMMQGIETQGNDGAMR